MIFLKTIFLLAVVCLTGFFLARINMRPVVVEVTEKQASLEATVSMAIPTETAEIVEAPLSTANAFQDLANTGMHYRINTLTSSIKKNRSVGMYALETIKDEPKAEAESSQKAPAKKENPAPIVKPEPKKEVVAPHLLVEAVEGAIPPTILLAAAQAVPFLVVNVTAVGGKAEVRSITIMNTGAASRTIFSAVGFPDLGNPMALKANNTYNTQAGFTLQDGETRTLVLIASMQFDLTGHQGEMPALAIKSIDADVPIEGTFPVVGTTHTVNTGVAIGSLTATASSYDPGLKRSFQIHSTKVTFSGIKVAAGNQEAIALTSMTWLQSGSVSPNDISDVRTYVVHNGKTYSFVAKQTGRFYISAIEGVVLGKGDSADIYVAGDVGDAEVGRTIDFDINQNIDVLGMGLDYKNNILAVGADVKSNPDEGQFALNAFPLYNGFKHTIVKVR